MPIIWNKNESISYAYHMCISPQLPLPPLPLLPSPPPPEYTSSSSSSSSSYLCVQDCALIALMQTDDCYGCPQSRLIVNLKPAN